MSTEKHTHITTVKTLMNASIIYFFCSMARGVFYREFTKLFDFTGKTTLGVIHGHLLVLGTFFFLLLAVPCKFTALGDQKLFQKFFLIYNIAFPLMAVTLLIRGIVQVTGYPMTRMLNGMLSGFAGLSHIFLAVALFLLLLAVKKNFVTKAPNNFLRKFSLTNVTFSLIL